jgi:hypothetical protein
MLQEAREPDRKESGMQRLEKRGKKKESFGPALSLPNTGSLLKATSGKAEKPAHGWTPGLRWGDAPENEYQEISDMSNQIFLYMGVVETNQLSCLDLLFLAFLRPVA